MIVKIYNDLSPTVDSFKNTCFVWNWHVHPIHAREAKCQVLGQFMDKVWTAESLLSSTVSLHRLWNWSSEKQSGLPAGKRWSPWPQEAETKYSLRDWTWIRPVLCLNPDKFLFIPVPQFSYLLNGDDEKNHLGLLWGLNELIHVACWQQRQAHTISCYHLDLLFYLIPWIRNINSTFLRAS